MEGNSLAWRQQLLNSHHAGGSEHLLVRCVGAPLLNDCHSWLRQPCCSASFSSSSYFFAACSLITAVVSTALYLQSHFFLFFFYSSLCLTHLLLNTWPPPFCCNQSLLSVFLCSASLPASSYSLLPTALLAAFPWLTSHAPQRNPPSLPSPHTRLISSVPTPSPTQCPLRWDERGAALWLICYVKTLSWCNCSSFWVSSEQIWVKPTWDLVLIILRFFLAGKSVGLFF